MSSLPESSNAAVIMAYDPDSGNPILEVDDEEDADAVDLGPNRIHHKPFDVLGKASASWKHFKVYPKKAKADNLAVCKLCYAKFIELPGVHSTKWEVKIGKSRSTSKLLQHINR